MNTTLLTLAAVAIIIAASAHSILGEARLVRRLVDGQRAILADNLARTVLRLAWHFTSALMLLTAAFLLFAAYHPTAIDERMVAAVGALYLVAGLIDGAMTKGKHDAWIPLTLIGILILSV